MKIGIVCPYDMQRPGGVQAHILAIAHALEARGHTLAVIAPGTASQRIDGQRVHGFGACRSFNFNQTQIDVTLALGRERRRLIDWVGAQKFDVLNVHTPWDPMLPMQVWSAAKGVPKVATFHDTPPETTGGRLTRCAFKVLGRWYARHAARITTVSSSPLGHLTAPVGTEIAVIPPVIDLSAFLGTPRNETKDGPLKITFIGRLDRRKGVAMLVDAFRTLQAETPDITLIIAGDGSDMTLLRNKSKDLTGVTFLGRIDDPMKIRLLSETDIFCAPSPYGESFGIVLTEAMAAGAPIVAAANAGYAQVLRERADDCLVAPGDTDALIRGLRRLIDNAPLRDDLSAWGRRTAPSHDISAWGAAYEQVFLAALG